MTAIHVSECLARIHATYDREITKPIAAEFQRQLETCDGALLDAATTEWIGLSSWMPKPAELLTIVRRLESEASPQVAEPEHWRRETYACRICRDTGYVTVWHPRAMQSAIWHVGGFIARNRLQLPTCDARCKCWIGMLKPAGVRKGTRADGTNGAEPVRYDESRMIHLDPALPSARQIDALLAWARDWKPKAGAGDRVDEFDDWNETPF